MTTLLLGSSGGNYPPGKDIRFEKMLGEWLTGVVDEWIDGVSGEFNYSPGRIQKCQCLEVPAGAIEP